MAESASSKVLQNIPVLVYSIQRKGGKKSQEKWLPVNKDDSFFFFYELTCSCDIKKINAISHVYTAFA